MVCIFVHRSGTVRSAGITVNPAAAGHAGAVLARAQQVAETIVNGLGGYGLFGVELFVRGEDIIFNEVSPRPHDTGLVTLISQNISQFALHVRAFLGLPAGEIVQYRPAASAVILPSLRSDDVRYSGLEHALTGTVQLRLFAKPEIDGSRAWALPGAGTFCSGGGKYCKTGGGISSRHRLTG